MKRLQELLALHEGIVQEGVLDLTPDQERAIANEIGDILGFDVEVSHVREYNGVYTASYTYFDKDENEIHKSMKFKGTLKDHTVENFKRLDEGVVTEKVHTLPNHFPKRGAPEPWERARAFDKVNPKTGARPDRSVLRQMEKGKGKYFGLEYADEGDFISVIVMRDDIEPTHGSKKKDPNDEYMGINVLFFPDGKIDADTYDLTSKRQWLKDKDKIVAAAKAALKDKDLPGQYDGLGGKEVKRGTGKLSFDTDNHVLRNEKKMSKHHSDGDYHGYHDKKTNEALSDEKRLKGQNVEAIIKVKDEIKKLRAALAKGEDVQAKLDAAKKKLAKLTD